jgi:hypothetical protein
MTQKLDIIEAEEAATSVIKGLRVRELPIDPYAIAVGHEIHVEPGESREPGVSGFLIRVGDVFGIKYATRIKNGSSGFSVLLS